jgi:hypothetical protein
MRKGGMWEGGELSPSERRSRKSESEGGGRAQGETESMADDFDKKK